LYRSGGGYTIVAVTTWTFIWLMVLLKIPIAALFLLVRWAVREPPESATEQDGGIGPRSRPLHPHHPRSRPPRVPRRGPHGDPSPPSPSRVRTVAARRRQRQS
jgi:hypothetical protein